MNDLGFLNCSFSVQKFRDFLIFFISKINRLFHGLLLFFLPLQVLFAGILQL